MSKGLQPAGHELVVVVQVLMMRGPLRRRRHDMILLVQITF
jgi:hypothetical protein